MGFVPFHQLLVAPGATPRRTALFLHGILGLGQNWRSTANKLVVRDGGWAAVLVDLRLHGRSRAAPPPHTLASAADDVERLAATLTAPVGAIVGHSFGGKVALELRRRAPAGLIATAAFDVSPSARPEEIERPSTPGSIKSVVEALEAVPRTYARRDELVAALGARGIAPRVGKWLAMSLHPAVAGGYELPFDPEGVRALLIDHLSTDLWGAVEDPALPGELTFYVAGRSDIVTEADRARLAAAAPRVVTRDFPDADHWMLTERDALTLPPA